MGLCIFLYLTLFAECAHRGWHNVSDKCTAHLTYLYVEKSRDVGLTCTGWLSHQTTANLTPERKQGLVTCITEEGKEKAKRVRSCSLKRTTNMYQSVLLNNSTTLVTKTSQHSSYIIKNIIPSRSAACMSDLGYFPT